jgi:hypothetical protein
MAHPVINQMAAQVTEDVTPTAIAIPDPTALLAFATNCTAQTLVVPLVRLTETARRGMPVLMAAM